MDFLNNLKDYLERKYDGISCNIEKVYQSKKGVGKYVDAFKVRYKGKGFSIAAVEVEDIEDFDLKIYDYVNKCLKDAGLI